MNWDIKYFNSQSKFDSLSNPKSLVVLTCTLRRNVSCGRLKIETSGGRPPIGRWVRARYVPLRRRVSRIFSRGKASSQAKRGMRPVIPRISPAREPRNGTRSPPSRVTAMKSFVIAPLTSRPPTSEVPPSSYPKALSIGSSAGLLFC